MAAGFHVPQTNGTTPSSTALHQMCAADSDDAAVAVLTLIQRHNQIAVGNDKEAALQALMAGIDVYPGGGTRTPPLRISLIKRIQWSVAVKVTAQMP